MREKKRGAVKNIEKQGKLDLIFSPFNSCLFRN
jgi:hypothetical protein